MRRYLLVSLVICVVGLGCHRWAPAPKPAAESSQRVDYSKADPVGDFVIGEPFRHGNLMIFPVMSKQPKLEDQYLTLDEGIKAGTVEIMELGAAPQRAAAPSTADPFGDAPPPARVVDDSRADKVPVPVADDLFGSNEVNLLVIVNRSDRPLYLMPGEIIVGGSQDRTIAKELVILPDKKPVSTDVFCVEHGRWGLRNRGETVELLAGRPKQAPLQPTMSMARCSSGWNRI